MRRKRITGRFYVFLILIGIGLYFVIRELAPLGTSEAIVTMAATEYSHPVDAVIVRDEAVTSFEGSGQVVYVAAEGAEVAQGQEIADVYAAGYSEKEITQLETVRQNIRAYHRSILDNIVDAQLERLEANVQQKALEVKTLIREKTRGSLINLEKQLQSAMQARQSYLNQNQRQDQKLTNLYDEETKRENAIASWRTAENASVAGIVSFYLDGCERFLTPANLEALTISGDMDEPKGVATGVVGAMRIFVFLEGVVDISAEKLRLQKEMAKMEKDLKQVANKLANQDFINKAAPAVIEKEELKYKTLRDKFTILENLYQKFEEIKG